MKGLSRQDLIPTSQSKVEYGKSFFQLKVTRSSKPAMYFVCLRKLAVEKSRFPRAAHVQLYHRSMFELSFISESNIYLTN